METRDVVHAPPRDVLLRRFVLRDAPVRRGRWLKVRAGILIGFGVLQLALAAYAALLPRLVFAPE